MQRLRFESVHAKCETTIQLHSKECRAGAAILINLLEQPVFSVIRVKSIIILQCRNAKITFIKPNWLNKPSATTVSCYLHEITCSFCVLAKFILRTDFFSPSWPRTLVNGGGFFPTLHYEFKISLIRSITVYANANC